MDRLEPTEPRRSRHSLKLLSWVSTINLHKRDSVQKILHCADNLEEFLHIQGKHMITDARAQFDLIATLHLETLYKTGHPSAGYDSNRAAHTESAIPLSNEHDAIQLRHRLAAIQSLAVRAQGLTIKNDMGSATSTRGNDAVTS